MPNGESARDCQDGPGFDGLAQGFSDWLNTRTDEEAIQNYDDVTKYPTHYRLKKDDQRTAFLGWCDRLILDYVWRKAREEEKQSEKPEDLHDYRLVMALLIATVPRDERQVVITHSRGTEKTTSKAINKKVEAGNLLALLVSFQRRDVRDNSTGTPQQQLTKHRRLRWLNNESARQVRHAVADYLGIEVPKQPGRSAANDERPESKATPGPVPALEIGSPDWAKNTVAAQREGVGPETLGSYRQRNKAQWIAPDNFSGIDRDGRMWRRTGTKNAHPYYYVPSLKSYSPPGRSAESKL